MLSLSLLKSVFLIREERDCDKKYNTRLELILSIRSSPTRLRFELLTIMSSGVLISFSL